MDTVLGLLEELEDLVATAPKQAFTGKAVVDRDAFFNIIEDIKYQLPKELKQSQAVVDKRNELLLAAQREAEEIIRVAEEKAQKKVESHEITKMAQAQCEEYIERTKADAKAKRLEVIQYSYDVFDAAEEKIKYLRDVFDEENKKIDAYFSEILDVIFENKQITGKPLEKNNYQVYDRERPEDGYDDYN